VLASQEIHHYAGGQEMTDEHETKEQRTAEESITEEATSPHVAIRISKKKTQGVKRGK